MASLLRLREMEQAGMKIRYEFANGEISEVEVSEELGRTLAEMTHRAALRDRAETRRHVSLDKLLSLGAQIGDGNPSVEELTEQALAIAALRRAVDQLEPQQRALVQKVFYENRSIASIAREEGVNPATVSHRLERIYRKLNKIFE